MKRDAALFSPDLIIEVAGKEEPIDISHIYSGEIFGKSYSFHTSNFVVKCLEVGYRLNILVACFV